MRCRDLAPLGAPQMRQKPRRDADLTPALLGAGATLDFEVNQAGVDVHLRPAQ
jgi:hypothetical protein